MTSPDNKFKIVSAEQLQTIVRDIKDPNSLMRKQCLFYCLLNSSMACTCDATCPNGRNVQYSRYCAEARYGESVV